MMSGESDGSQDSHVEPHDEIEDLVDVHHATASSVNQAEAEGSGEGDSTESGDDILPSIPSPAEVAVTAQSVAPPVAVRPAYPEEDDSKLTEEQRRLKRESQKIRVKLLRVAKRLGVDHNHPIVSQVLYRIQYAEQLKVYSRQGQRPGMPSGAAEASFDAAALIADELDAKCGPDSPLDFSCRVLLMGKSGVGKSSVINSVVERRETVATNPFESETDSVHVVRENVGGVEFEFIDTPGLKVADGSSSNESILSRVKGATKKSKPDIVLYVDRLDLRSNYMADEKILRNISKCLGPKIWFNTIVVLTHGSAAPPDGTNYDVNLATRGNTLQQLIRRASNDNRLITPIAIAENHVLCRRNKEGQRVLPNGQAWREHLLLLALGSKILQEANALLMLDSEKGAAQLSGQDLLSQIQRQQRRLQAPPLPYLLSSLITSRPPRRDHSDGEEEEAGIIAEGEEDEMDEEAAEDEAAQVSVPAPDPALPPSFDSDNPTHRYRYLEGGQRSWIVRPMVENHSWDHEAGIDGFSLEKQYMIRKKFPAFSGGQITKDKKTALVQIENEATFGPHKFLPAKPLTTAGVDINTLGKDYVTTMRGEQRLKISDALKLGYGGSIVFMDRDTRCKGGKAEARWKMRKEGKKFPVNLTASGGIMMGKGERALGCNGETTIHHKADKSGGRTSMQASLMLWRGVRSVGCNVQSQMALSDSTALTFRSSLNSQGQGTISTRLNTTEHMSLAAFGLLPVASSIWNRLTTLEE